MRRGKTKYVSSERSDKGAKHTVRKTKRTTAGQTRPKVFEKDPLALPKKIKYAGRGRPPKSPNKVKIVTPLPTKAARKQPAEEEEYEVNLGFSSVALSVFPQHSVTMERRWHKWNELFLTELSPCPFRLSKLSRTGQLVVTCPTASVGKDGAPRMTPGSWSTS